jgi:hypothetical protein
MRQRGVRKRRMYLVNCSIPSNRYPLCLLLRSAENGGLNSIAKIDTTVTVVDAFRFFEEFETIELT